MLLAMAAGLLTAAAHAADEDALIRRAFVYAFPLHETGRLLLSSARNAPLQFAHRRTLATAADRGSTTPEIATLTSSAWLNLAQGPVKLTVPDTQGRYYSVALIDAATDNFATVGRRTTGTRAGEFVVVGPDWVLPLPEGARVIRAPGNDVLVLLRLQVDGPADLAQANRLQDGFALAPLQARPGATAASAPAAAAAAPAAPGSAPAAPPQTSAAERWLTIVNTMLARNPPPAYERALLEQLAAVGICGAGCSWEAVPPAVQARWNTLLPQLVADLDRRARDGEQRSNGWSRPRAATADFGTNYEARAQAVKGGSLALRPAEAMTLFAREDTARRPLTGMHTYRLHLPPAALAVDAFWSLAMYEQDIDGRLVLVTNPIARFAIGDRTPGLRRNRDGSIDLWIQRADPGRNRQSNWLPAPPGPFVLALRAYQPRTELLDGRTALPGVERVE